jgi:hypothetical protein
MKLLHIAPWWLVISGRRLSWGRKQYHNSPPAPGRDFTAELCIHNVANASQQQVTTALQTVSRQ